MMISDGFSPNDAAAALNHESQTTSVQTPAAAAARFQETPPGTAAGGVSLIHHVNLEALLQGDGSILKDFGASVLTWRNVADRLSLGQTEIAAQVEFWERLMTRHEAGEPVVLDSRDEEIARQGVVIMDMLAAEVDIATAAWCAERAEAEIERRFKPWVRPLRPAS